MAPAWLPKKYRKLWASPASFRARHSAGFHKVLWRHGYVSPHFTKAEWRCHNGVNVPDSLRKNAQRHAFNLELFRHRLGGPALPILSAYRTPAYNRQIGGATKSQHMSADATDFAKALIDKIGRARWFAEADRVFANGGVGRYPGGSGHLDSRGWRARWTSF